jgi:adenylate kinase
VNILLLGPQGSGKGTQAGLIKASYGLPHIATGDMLRREAAAGTELGKRAKPILDAGELVPDDLMIEVIRERLDADDVDNGFILDGFPRTMAQAEALDRMLREIERTLTIVLQLEVPEEECVRRLIARSRNESRTDDTPEAIRTRLALYRRETEPLVEYYRTQGILVGIPGDRPVDAVFASIQDALEAAAVRQ